MLLPMDITIMLGVVVLIAVVIGTVYCYMHRCTTAGKVVDISNEENGQVFIIEFNKDGVTQTQEYTNRFDEDELIYKGYIIEIGTSIYMCIKNGVIKGIKPQKKSE